MITHLVTDEYPLILPPPRIARSEGVHVSNIIRCIATKAGILKPEWADELSLTDARTITDPVAILRISIGLAWEEHYIPLLPGVIDHPEEVCVDGVYMSKDGESLTTVVRNNKTRLEFAIHEVKATYKSTKTVGNLTSQWMWLAQIKAYCHSIGTLVAYLHVLFLCGDYSFPIRPVREVWRIDFTKDEIEDNWKLLMRYKNSRAMENK
jgi:hypothetical protein